MANTLLSGLNTIFGRDDNQSLSDSFRQAIAAQMASDQKLQKLESAVLAMEQAGLYRDRTMELQMEMMKAQAAYNQAIMEKQRREHMLTMAWASLERQARELHAQLLNDLVGRL